ncbi:hypothetical protein THIOKS12830005 [Thiocapsa sp. KS1]|nr:hypothetical protein THIOKS12830005 [Thiocapsa sp. KS1]
MLNWDDPLATTGPAARAPGVAFVVDPTDTAGDWSVDPTTDTHTATASRATRDTAPVRPGHGLVSNADLMATAGAAPVVDPNPSRHTPHSRASCRSPTPCCRPSRRRRHSSRTTASSAAPPVSSPSRWAPGAYASTTKRSSIATPI